MLTDPQDRAGLTLLTDEYACVCPTAGQSNFTTINMQPVPDQRFAEARSPKRYQYSCRQVGEFKVRSGFPIPLVATHTMFARMAGSAARANVARAKKTRRG